MPRAHARAPGDSVGGALYAGRRKTLRAGVRDMAKHKHGDMDTSEQERTFAGFLKFAVWTAVICIALLIFVALLNA